MCNWIGRKRHVLGASASFFTVGLCLMSAVDSTARAQSATAPVEVTLLELVDANGDTPSDPSSLLFHGLTPGHEPVLAPPYDVDPSQRQQLTLADISGVGGTGHIERVPEGTRLTLELSGLQPGGVYTVWSDFYVPPGLTPDFANSVGLGAFGAADGSENSFVAASDGTASFEGIQPPGPLSIYGEAPEYALAPGISDYILFIAYHIDGQTHGTVPAPAGLEHTFASYAIVDFANPIPEPSSVALLVVAAFGAFISLRKRLD